MTQFQIGQRVSGTFSKLNFSGVVVGFIAECVKIKVDNPHHNLPVVCGVLTFHPNDKNVSL